MAPQKRKVDNLTALAVLSVMIQRPMHRYEMATTLRAFGKDQDMDIKWGSLYTVVKNMEKHGFLEPIETTRDGARPERTVYQITDAGKQELHDWTRELISTPQTEHPKFAAGLGVMAALPPAEAIDALQTRITLLEQRIAAERTARESYIQTVPRLFLIEEEYALAMLDAEVAWVRSLLEELSSGSFPGMAVWQAFHDTGILPSDMTEAMGEGTTPD